MRGISRFQVVHDSTVWHSTHRHTSSVRGVSARIAGLHILLLLSLARAVRFNSSLPWHMSLVEIVLFVVTMISSSLINLIVISPFRGKKATFSPTFVVLCHDLAALPKPFGIMVKHLEGHNEFLFSVGVLHFPDHQWQKLWKIDCAVLLCIRLVDHLLQLQLDDTLFIGVPIVLHIGLPDHLLHVSL